MIENVMVYKICTEESMNMYNVRRKDLIPRQLT